MGPDWASLGSRTSEGCPCEFGFHRDHGRRRPGGRDPQTGGTAVGTVPPPGRAGAMPGGRGHRRCTGADGPTRAEASRVAVPRGSRPAPNRWLRMSRRPRSSRGVREWSGDPTVDAVLLQEPLPRGVDEVAALTPSPPERTSTAHAGLDMRKGGTVVGPTCSAEGSCDCSTTTTSIRGDGMWWSSGTIPSSDVRWPNCSSVGVRRSRSSRPTAKACQPGCGWRTSWSPVPDDRAWSAAAG